MAYSDLSADGKATLALIHVTDDASLTVLQTVMQQNLKVAAIQAINAKYKTQLDALYAQIQTLQNQQANEIAALG